MPTKIKLTEAGVRKLKAPTSDGKPATVYDTEVRGLAVLISGRTTSKSYVVNFGTKFQRRTIGDTTLFTLDDARDKAVEMLKLMRKGIDPKSVSKPAPQASTVTLRQLLDRRVHDDNRPLRQASVKCYEAVCKKHLADWLDRPITEITADAVHDRHKHIFKTARKAEGQDGRTVADLTVRVLGSLFTYGKCLRGSDRVGGLPEVNPVDDVDYYLKKVIVRTSHVADADLPKFWQCLDQINPTHAVLIKLILLTGLRVGCARQLTWKHIDLEARAIRIPGALMKGKRDHALPIVSGLFDILSAWRARGIETSGYAFPSPQHGKHVTELRLDFQYIEKVTGIDVSAHDLRRTFARACKKAGINKWTAAELLAHAGHSQTDDYAGQSDPDDLRPAMQQVTDYLIAKCGGNVIKLAAA